MAAKYGVQLILADYVPASQTLIYTVPSTLNRLVLSTFRVVNTDTTARTLTVWIVQTGESIADKHQAYVSKSLKLGETAVLSEIIGEPLGVGDMIYAQASVADKVTITIGATTFPAT